MRLFVYLMLAAVAPTIHAQSGRPDVLGSWNISIQVNGGSQIPDGASLPYTVSEVLSLAGYQAIQEQTMGDMFSGVVSSAGVGNWTYLYSSTPEAGVKLVALVATKDGAPLGIRTTVLRIKPGQDNQTLTGTYKATLVDTGGNTIYQVTGTLTGTRLQVDIADEKMN
jgi:hypothetical protein